MEARWKGRVEEERLPVDEEWPMREMNETAAAAALRAAALLRC